MTLPSEWRQHAACRPTPGRSNAPAMDTTDPREARRLIQRHCRRCPVVSECAREAAHIARTAPRFTGTSNLPEGVWAGILWVDGRPLPAAPAAAERTAA